jgi:hypothetical protein
LQDAILQRFIAQDQVETAEAKNRLFSYSQQGSLADFGSRIFMARMLGLFGPKTFSDLEIIRIIRNIFAHAPTPQGVDDPTVSEACKLLSRTIREKVMRPSFSRTNSERYIVACIEITSHLIERKAPPPEFPMWDDLLP